MTKKKKHPTTVRLVNKDVAKALAKEKRESGAPIERQVEKILKNHFDLQVK